MMGGIQGVIWTDVVQFFVMFGGLTATVAIVWASVPGGFSAIWDTAMQAGLLHPSPALVDPGASGVVGQVVSFLQQPMTLPSLMIALVVGRAATYTTDQIMVQRLQTTRSLPEARRAFVINAAGDALWMLGLSFVGLALFAYFRTHPLPAEYQTDKLVPYFMSLAFPAGAVGLVIAAIAAASMSSLNSAINSCSSVAVVDFYNRLWLGRNLRRGQHTPDEEQRQLWMSKAFTALFGIAGTVAAINVSRLGSLLEINSRVVNAFNGPLFGIYVLGMFCADARSSAVLASGLVGAGVSYYIAFHSSFGFLWPTTFGFAATLAVGWGLSLVAPAPADAKGRALTFAAVTKRDA
jgi:SSS family solute:Na+ symporter